MLLWPSARMLIMLAWCYTLMSRYGNEGLGLLYSSGASLPAREHKHHLRGGNRQMITTEEAKNRLSQIIFFSYHLHSQQTE